LKWKKSLLAPPLKWKKPPLTPPLKQAERTTPNPSFQGGGHDVGGGQLPYKSISNLSSRKEVRRKLRNNATPAEVILWKALQGKKLDGFKFRRQHSIGYYVLDFFCPNANLAIELDGDHHFSEEGLKYDRQRDEFLVSVGITVVRYANNLVFENLKGVLQSIREYLKVGRTTPISSLKGEETTPSPFVETRKEKAN
jgi:very-short-patch-repair endonuclease